MDGFVVALPALIEALREDDPAVPSSLFHLCPRSRTVNQVEYSARLGVGTVIVEEGNRDFRLLRALVRSGFHVEVLVNQTCIRDCPYRGHHLNTSSLCSPAPGASGSGSSTPCSSAGRSCSETPPGSSRRYGSGPKTSRCTRRPGSRRFKISGRNRSTEWLVQVARAYASRHWEGNLLDLLSLVQVKGPRRALDALAEEGRAPELVGPWRAAFSHLDNVVVDNQAFPPGVHAADRRDGLRANLLR